MDTKTKTSVNPNEVTEYEYYVGGNLQKVTFPDDSEILFDKLVLSEVYSYGGVKNPKAPTKKQWMKAIKGYGPTSGNDDYDVDVMNIFLKGKPESGTFLFDPDECFTNRFSR